MQKEKERVKIDQLIWTPVPRLYVMGDGDDILQTILTIISTHMNSGRPIENAVRTSFQKRGLKLEPTYLSDD